MKARLQTLLEKAIETLKSRGELDVGLVAKVNIDRARDTQHGDYASNLALTLAGRAGTKPRALAEKIMAVIPADDSIIFSTDV